ncbi:hypothetical protein [Amniculibacterium sp. G2-70]|uniref:hypothetical protein n=1 Tax=Amniculibacterium sp. G2-70 TaxID=2767188 RepID=UPI001654374D|nr:hypothetical protein [Amniculibacterium sp. G2-70]
MKKLILLLTIATAGICSAQAKFSIKANLAVPTASSTWKDVSSSLGTTYDESGKNSVGYNVGLSSKISLPGTSFFVMPEIYYTEFKNNFTESKTNTTLSANNKRVDVPVLVGMDLVGEYFGVYAGPVALFKLKNNKWYNDFEEFNTKKFALGYQLGAQLTIKNLIVSGRYEGTFNREERNFINQQTGQDIVYDNSPSLLFLGLGYQF